MTNWWSTSPESNSGGNGGEWKPEPMEPEEPYRPTPPPPVPAPLIPAPRQPIDEDVAGEPDHRRPVRAHSKGRIAVGAVAVAAVGLLAMSAANGSEEGAREHVATDRGAMSDAPPAAGGGVFEDPVLDEPKKSEPAPSRTREKLEIPKKVILAASPAGKGDTGVMVQLTITNGTSESVSLIPSMIQADGNSGILGEGTLAPGKSRMVEPGKTVFGTVEFSASSQPSQVAILGGDYNPIATSEVIGK